MHTVVFGAGRQGRVVYEILRAQGTFIPQGFLDDSVVDDQQPLPILGGMEWARAHVGQSVRFLVAIGNNRVRVRIATQLRNLGFEAVNAIHPSAVIMPDVSIGNGVVICAGAVIVSGTKVEDDAVINTAASVDHDSVVERGAYLSPGVHTAGAVHIGASAFIGTGATLGPNIRIGEETIIGAGAVVLCDIPDHVLAFGVPARVQKKLDDDDWARLCDTEL